MSQEQQIPNDWKAHQNIIHRERICFRACNGIPTEALEQGVVAKLVEALEFVQLSYINARNSSTYPGEELEIVIDKVHAALALIPRRDEKHASDHDATAGPDNTG